MDPTDLLDALRGERDVEAAAEQTLRALLDIVSQALEDAELPNARALRAMLHLRPDDGYAGLYVLEQGAPTLTAPGEDGALLPSATVWALMRAEGVPVAVDVAMQTAQPRGGEAREVEWGGGFDVKASAHRLLQRQATHLYMLPLHAPGRLAGMLSVEAACLEAMGTPFVWPACADALERVAALAGPYLAALPPPASAPGGGASGDDRLRDDPLLPVVGDRMAPIVRVLRAFAGEEETLLVRGETGTGKSRLARWVHAHSARQSGPFEVLDLLAVPDETQLGELFGWRRGAFTGAVNDHAGAGARAERGTLFIDEIDKLSLRAQAGLLTLLEERRFRVMGDRGAPREADVRFVVGTNTDLAQAVREGRFREDLYYRINVLPVALPPLRERADEIPSWATFMLSRHHAEKRRDGAVNLTAEAGHILARHPWPGNLRELDNVMRRAYTFAAMDGGDTVTVEAQHATTAMGAGLTPRAAEGLVAALAAAADTLATRLASGDASVDGVAVPAAFSGLLLAAAIDTTGTRDEAFRLVGRGRLLDNRNHHKALKREAVRALELCHALREPPPPTLARRLETLGL